MFEIRQFRSMMLTLLSCAIVVCWLMSILPAFDSSLTKASEASKRTKASQSSSTARGAGAGASASRKLDYDAFVAYASMHNKKSSTSSTPMIEDPVENLKFENTRYCSAIVDSLVSAPEQASGLISAYKQQVGLLLDVFVNSRKSGRKIDLTSVLSDSIYYCQLCLFRLMKHALKLKPNTMVTKTQIEDVSFSWVFMITQELMKLKARQLDDDSEDSLRHIIIDISRTTGRDSRDILSLLTLYHIGSAIPVIKTFLDTEAKILALKSSSVNIFSSGDGILSGIIASSKMSDDYDVHFHPSICDAIGNKDLSSLTLLLSGGTTFVPNITNINATFSTLSDLIHRLDLDSSYFAYDDSNYRVGICKRILQKVKEDNNYFDSSSSSYLRNILSIADTPISTLALNENEFCPSSTVELGIGGGGIGDSTRSPFIDDIELGYSQTSVQISSRHSNRNANNINKEEGKSEGVATATTTATELPHCAVLKIPLSKVTRACLVHALVIGRPMLITLNDDKDSADLASSGINAKDWSIDSLSSIKGHNVVAGEIPYSSIFGMKEKSFSFDDFANAKSGFHQYTSKLKKLENLRRKIISLLKGGPTDTDGSIVSQTSDGSSSGTGGGVNGVDRRNASYDLVIVINSNIVSLVRSKPTSASEDANKALVRQVLEIFIAENSDFSLVHSILDNNYSISIVGLTSRYIKLLSEIINQPRYYMFARKTITTRGREIINNNNNNNNEDIYGIENKNKNAGGEIIDAYLQKFLDKFDVERHLVNSKFWDLVTWLSNNCRNGSSSSAGGDNDESRCRKSITHLQMYVGGPLSGAAFHSHGPALNFLVAGRKRWRLQAPYPRSHYSNMHPLDYLERPVGDCEMLQRSGEILYVPKFFSHEVLNLAESVGFALEIQDYI